MEEEKSNDFVWIMHEIIAYFFKKRYTRYNETTNWIKNTKNKEIARSIIDIINSARISLILHEASGKFKFLSSFSKQRLVKVRSRMILNPI